MTQKTKTIIGAGLILIVTVAIFLFYWSRMISVPTGENKKEDILVGAEKENSRLEKPEATDVFMESGTGVVTELKGKSVSIKTSDGKLVLEAADRLTVFMLKDGKTFLLSPTNLKVDDRISFGYDKASKKIFSITILKK